MTVSRSVLRVLIMVGSALAVSVPAYSSDLLFDDGLFGPGQEVAEFRADLQPTDVRDSRLRFNRDPLFDALGPLSATAEDQTPGTARVDFRSADAPGAERLPVSTFMRVMDRRFRESLASGTSQRTAREITVGPRISVGDSSATYIYLRRGQELEHDGDLGLLGADDGFESSGAGVEQVWLWGDDGGRLNVGYEFAEESLGFRGSERISGHTVRLGSNIPLRWGLSARVEAGYTRSLYSDLNGDPLNGDRMEISAGLSGRLGERLSGSFGYLYADDDMEASSMFPTSRHVWGLNLQFLY